MKNKVTITVRTDYSGNVKSMGHFGIAYKSIPGVGLVARQEFENEDDAKSYLKNRAEMYADTDEQLDDLYQQIESNGCLTLDAAWAEIEEIQG